MLEFIKENTLLSALAVYLITISLISVVLCIYDKIVSLKNNVKLRIPESTLMLSSILGGSAAMFLCMILIRHKTNHIKFMLGIPLIVIAQAFAVYMLFYYGIF